MSEPALYRQFASKRDLWAACLDAAWEEFRDGFGRAVGSCFAGERGAGRMRWLLGDPADDD